MLYKDIIKKLAKQNCITFADLASRIGLKSQSTLSVRLKDSWNPGMKDAQDMLAELGYEIVFAPKGMVSRSSSLSETCYVPEFPEKPASKGGAR